MAQKLRKALLATHLLVDEGNCGAAQAHIGALEIAAGYDDRCVIIEDDAIPVVGFHAAALEWMDRFPSDLLSFYLGTGRPIEWQNRIDCLTASAKAAGKDHISVPKLLHAVCYSIPAHGVRKVLDGIDSPEVDFAIGRAWGKPTVYPVESLVEHRDGKPVERHADGRPRVEARVARKLAGPLMYED